MKNILLLTIINFIIYIFSIFTVMGFMNAIDGLDEVTGMIPFVLLINPYWIVASFLSSICSFFYFKNINKENK